MVKMIEGIAGYAGEALDGKCSRVTKVEEGSQTTSTYCDAVIDKNIFHAATA